MWTRPRRWWGTCSCRCGGGSISTTRAAARWCRGYCRSRATGRSTPCDGGGGGGARWNGGSGPAGRGGLRLGGLGATWSPPPRRTDRKSTRLNSSHLVISYAVFCLKKKKTKYEES